MNSIKQFIFLYMTVSELQDCKILQEKLNADLLDKRIVYPENGCYVGWN